MMETVFERLIRFQDPTGEILFGEAPSSVDGDDFVGQKALVYAGEQPWLLKPTGEQREISKIFAPLPSTPIIYGVGWNYGSHLNENAEERTFKYPTIFTKPPRSLAGPYEDIPVNKQCLELDYEGELVVVIGKICRDLGPEDNVFDYILGYTIGNDVSSRYWQAPERSCGQHAYAKSFDKFAPIGPVLASPSVISDPSSLSLVTLVNGEKRQSASTADMIFRIPQIIHHLSRGTTLDPGTAIFTGTPAGVAIFMDTPLWLKNGDTVEISIDGIGKMANTFYIGQ